MAGRSGATWPWPWTWRSRPAPHPPGRGGAVALAGPRPWVSEVTWRVRGRSPGARDSVGGSTGTAALELRPLCTLQHRPGAGPRAARRATKPRALRRWWKARRAMSQEPQCLPFLGVIVEGNKKATGLVSGSSTSMASSTGKRRTGERGVYYRVSASIEQHRLRLHAILKTGAARRGRRSEPTTSQQ